MLDYVKNPIDGFGTCTTVQCLVTAAFEAARTYMLAKFEKQRHTDHGYYGADGEYHETDGHYNDDGTYHTPSSMEMCPEMCQRDMETMRFTDKKAAE